MTGKKRSPSHAGVQNIAARNVQGTKAQQMHARVRSGMTDSRTAPSMPQKAKPQPTPVSIGGKRYMWEAKIDQGNVWKVLERTCSITDSLKLVRLDRNRKSHFNYSVLVTVARKHNCVVVYCRSRSISLHESKRRSVVTDGKSE